MPSNRIPPPPRSPKREEGFVLLVVMLVLMMAGSSSMLAVDSTREVLRTSGHQRMASQVRYLAEGVTQLGIALADNTGTPLPGIPNMRDFGQPPLPAGGYADKAYQLTPAQFEMSRWGAYEAPIWANPDALGDQIGTMGPNNGWSPSHALDAGHQHMVVHFVDCVHGRSAGAAGSQMAGGHVSQVDLTETQYCIALGRARSAAPASPTRTWEVPGLSGDYIQQLLSIDRTSVATLVLTRETTQ